MCITDIRLTKRGRMSIYVDGEFTCTLHTDIYATSKLEVGQEITSQRLEELFGLSQEKIAKESALRLLSQRSYTAKGLRDKLAKHADQESAQTAVARMEELGLVDDADYARRYAAYCLKTKGYSIRRTAQALREKGIHRELAQEVLSEIEIDPELAVARVVLRKYMRYLEDEKGVNKTINALARLGFAYEDIRRVVSNLQKDNAYYDDYEIED